MPKYIFMYQSVQIPSGGKWYKKLLAFAGPGMMIAVGYMDPGNWATDIAGGSAFAYTLLSVILLSNLFAMLLQHLALKLGIVTGLDLAQACRHYFPKRVNYFLWFICEIAIIATDLAEVIGSAIALNLLFSIPLTYGVLITGLDVFLLLFLQDKKFRLLELLVVVLIAVILGSFIFELAIAQPQIGAILKGFIPNTAIITNPAMLFVAIGIMGATVMPHNLYLHSAIIKTRKIGSDSQAKREAILYATIDSSASLLIAFFINAAILILAASAFYYHGHYAVADIKEAHQLLYPILGVKLAGIFFALALLASGQNSTITGTMAGQIVMEGFLDIQLKPWLRRLFTRLLAIIPALLLIILHGEDRTVDMLVWSQVILSLQLSFAVVPLVYFTSNRVIMNQFVNSRWLNYAAWTIAIIIIGLNLWMLVTNFL